jgi:hypothetical protein
MSAREENIIELEQNEEGVFVPSRVTRKQEKPRSQRQRVPTRQQREIKRIADQIQIPEVQQFLYGANAVLDIAERFKKAFK